ncbi:cobalt/nickel transport system permease protein [Tessaracoccus bendigoensis DSM 12906]|uniref:Cobalt/nickel transport system permease protein n=1 Tax=Tessaracoccus bendigoensis DSM 12906 TaxID=1123357 RepID=A0A1M6LC99_9ACTN|nr:cobalt ECF transporter T component CbiQ [Tessaracoccus bendigoensis]SHJ68715.1 cobalt/nickel transport system permease protein [Tessaracoccus bendigoensis DSM 12906]
MTSHDTTIDDAAWASPWRRRRVGEKVLLSVSLVLTALLTPPWPGCVLVACLSVFLILGPARIRASLLATVMIAPVTFLIIGALPVAIHLGGDGWGIGPVRINADGATTALGLIAHGIAGTLALMVLATTTPMVDVITWLRALRVPDPLLDIASLTYRLLFVLLSTTLAVRQAQVARLGDAASWRRRWHALASTIGSIILRSWQRATNLQRGLEGRGYEESLRTLSPRRARSWPFIGVSLASVAGVWATCWVLA